MAIKLISASDNRMIGIHGEKGEIYGVFFDQRIDLKLFGGEEKIFDLKEESAMLSCYGGGYKNSQRVYKILIVDKNRSAG